MHLIFGTTFLVILAYVGFVFVKDFIGEKGSTRDRLLAAGKNSATILWGRFMMICTAGVAGLAEIADWLNAPGIGDAIKSHLKPEYVGAFVIATLVVNEIARRRTL